MPSCPSAPSCGRASRDAPRAPSPWSASSARPCSGAPLPAYDIEERAFSFPVSEPWFTQYSAHTRRDSEFLDFVRNLIPLPVLCTAKLTLPHHPASATLKVFPICSKVFPSFRMFFAPIRTVLFTFVIAIQFDLSDHALSPAEVSHRARKTTTAETTTAETTTAEEGGKRGSSCPVPLPLRVSACLPLPLPSPCVLLFCLQQAQ